MDGGGGSSKSTTITTPKPLEGMEEIPKYVGGWMLSKDKSGNYTGQIPEIFSNTIPYLQEQVWGQPIGNRLAGFSPEERWAQESIKSSYPGMNESLWNIQGWMNDAMWGGNGMPGYIPYGNAALTNSFGRLNDYTSGMLGRGYGDYTNAYDTFQGWNRDLRDRAYENLGSSYSQFDDWTNNLRNRAEDPYQMGMGNLENTIRGDYVKAGSNPYLADYMKMASRPTLEALDKSMAQNASSAELAGRETGGLRQALNAESTDQATRALNELNTGIAMGAYLPERQMQQGATGQAMGQMNQLLGFNQGKTQLAADMMNKAQGYNQAGMQTAADMFNAAQGYNQGTAQLANQMANSGMGYLMQQPGLQSQLMDQFFQNTGALASVGEQNRMMDQTEMDMRRQMAFEPYSDIVNYFLDPMIGLTTGQMGSSTTQQVQQPSGLNTALGAGSQMAGLGAALKYILGGG